MTKVCIVEDNDQIRDTLNKRINQCDDLECIGAYPDTVPALKYIPRRKPEVVIMDIDLPNMSGIECMLRLKDKFPEMQFLMFTIFDDDNVFEALKAGASGYILKNEGIKGVIERVRELINGGAPMSDQIAKKILLSFRNKHKISKEVEKLTPRQMEIVNLLAKGLVYKEIASELKPQISIGGVKQHISRIYKVLAVNNRTEAINKWLNRNA